MKPKEYKKGGAGATIRFAIAESSLGPILVASSEKDVCAILMGDDPDLLAKDLQDRFPKAHLIGGDENYERLIAKVVGFIEAPKIGLALPLDVRGTAFQRRVWKALMEIPIGIPIPGSPNELGIRGQRVPSPELAKRISSP
jgi:AraC family transcriptional regulator, regulatory protein of adaptative response / methylated-DNA-[protein]-cysteine methyltransferase